MLEENTFRYRNSYSDERVNEMEQFKAGKKYAKTYSTAPLRKNRRSSTQRQKKCKNELDLNDNDDPSFVYLPKSTLF